jgi:hypothetical protein
LSEKTPRVVRETPQAAASRAGDSERIQAAIEEADSRPAKDHRLDSRACAALGVAFGFGILVGYHASRFR